ncbi:MAG TPA: glycosyl hydrolase family 18 protein [Saprospiraceae bacterium]|nr:glycosyl hydrolase family 18 protein [Saprospiraceae bacterium]
MKTTTLLSLFLLTASTVFTQEFKVVGYLAMWNTGACEVSWDRLTHVNLAFANPDINGDLHVDGADPDPVIAAAHAHGVQVFVSLAGGYLQPDWENAWNFWMQPGQRGTYIGKIVQYLIDHDLDGVDIDLEWQYVNDQYSPFVLALKDSLQLAGFPMTAALPGSYRYPEITQEALAAFDWVNLMVYDLTGPWAPANAGPHSPFWWAEQCLQYWNDQGLTGSRQTLGVPFYGYDFGANPVQGLDYREIVAMDTAYAQLDQVGQLYYNGIPTIVAKTRLALEQTSGIMIWELAEDVCSDLETYSLLAAIERTIQLTPVIHSTAPLPFSIFPNPAIDEIRIGQPNLAGLHFEIIDIQGTVKQSNRLADDGIIRLKGLPPGLYMLQLQSGARTSVKRFIKM